MSVSTTTPVSPRDRGLTRQSIVESVLTDVFRGRLHAGQHLVTRELAERFGVSHTPIREALIALSGMGVVDLIPNRGALVQRVTSRDVAEIAHVRRLLECAAVRSACGRIELSELDDLRRELAATKTPKNGRAARFIDKARRLDDRLHDLISTSSGNRFLAQELNRLKLLFRVFRDVAWEQEEARNDYRRLGEETREHLAIVDALLEGDAKSASRAMSQHIRNGTRYWSRVVKNGDSDTNGADY
ncbi:MAG: GntR family transcriptional regulator [Planctomycetota bacterium]|nr:MAG: GntR family transcriptional regulator [Planctomycetota bacterium]REK22424.1 MAG: GntR family transcriptional regulator [Planctomycetota bacterium]REK34926.1 MAG: GntR family transcriptional regulator [Planctomycetota bacterium]